MERINRTTRGIAFASLSLPKVSCWYLGRAFRFQAFWSATTTRCWVLFFPVVERLWRWNFNKIFFSCPHLDLNDDSEKEIELGNGKRGCGEVGRCPAPGETDAQGVPVRTLVTKPAFFTSLVIWGETSGSLGHTPLCLKWAPKSVLSPGSRVIFIPWYF